MSVTIHLVENENVRLTDEVIDTRPPDRIGFAVHGVITVTEELLGTFGGTTLKPARVDISIDELHTVEVDLTGEASLRLETVDIGIETPGVDDLSPGIDTLRSSEDSDTTATHPGAIAFTVEGAILDASEATLESVSGGSPTVEALTFAVEDPVRSDGGSDDDVLFEFNLFGYNVAVARNGVIDIGTGGGTTDIGLP